MSAGPNVPKPPGPLAATELRAALAHRPGWALQGAGAEQAICRRYEFASYAEVLAFANAVAWLAQRRDHHPELLLSYRHCTVSWRSHDAGGVTALDLACAAWVDELRGAV